MKVNVKKKIMRVKLSFVRFNLSGILSQNDPPLVSRILLQ